MKRFVKTIIFLGLSAGCLNASDNKHSGMAPSWKTKLQSIAKNTSNVVGNAACAGLTALTTLFVCAAIGKRADKAIAEIKAKAWIGIKTTDSQTLFLDKYGQALFSGIFIAGGLLTTRFVYKTLKSVKNALFFVDSGEKSNPVVTV